MITRNPVLVIGIIGTLAATAATILMIAGRPAADQITDRTPESRLIASSDMPTGTRIDLINLHGSNRTSRLSPTETAMAERIIGKITVHDIHKGDEVHDKDVESNPAPTTWNSVVIPRGLRGLNVQMPSGMEDQPNLVRAGDRVDILGISNPGGVSNESHVVAQDVPVLARFEHIAHTEGASAPPANGSSATLMLGVTHEQAIRISEAEIHGKIRFLVRNPTDRTVFQDDNHGAAPNPVSSAPPKTKPAQSTVAAPVRPVAPVGILPPAAGNTDSVRHDVTEIRVIRGTQAEWIPVPLPRGKSAR